MRRGKEGGVREKRAGGQGHRGGEGKGTGERREGGKKEVLSGREEKAEGRMATKKRREE